MYRPTRRHLAPIALLAALALLVGACGGGDDDGGTAATVEGPTIRIAPQNFSESRTLTEVYAQYLEARGYDVEVLEALGFREVVYPGIEGGEIDLIVDYTGGAQTELVPDETPSGDPDEVYATVEEAVAALGATALEPSPADSRDALLVRPDTAEDLGLETISDLAGQADDLTFGSSSECVSRAQCLPAYTDVYGITFGDTVALDYGPPLADGLREGELDVIHYQATAPAIEEDDLVVLEDDEGVLLAQNVVPILRDEVLEAYEDTDLVADIDALSSQLTTEDLRAWNVATDIDLEEPVDVAAAWLEEQGLL